MHALAKTNEMLIIIFLDSGSIWFSVAILTELSRLWPWGSDEASTGWWGLTNIVGMQLKFAWKTTKPE